MWLWYGDRLGNRNVSGSSCHDDVVPLDYDYAVPLHQGGAHGASCDVSASHGDVVENGGFCQALSLSHDIDV